MSIHLQMKKSHCFAFAVFGGIAGSLAAVQMLRAATGRMSWEDLPAVVTLTTLGAGLLAIMFNLAWVMVRETYFHLPEEPSDYEPTKEALSTAATAFVAVSMLAPPQAHHTITGVVDAATPSAQQVR